MRPLLLGFAICYTSIAFAQNANVDADNTKKQASACVGLLKKLDVFNTIKSLASDYYLIRDVADTVGSALQIKPVQLQSGSDGLEIAITGEQTSGQRYVGTRTFSAYGNEYSTEDYEHVYYTPKASLVLSEQGTQYEESEVTAGSQIVRVWDTNPRTALHHGWPMMPGMVKTDSNGKVTAALVAVIVTDDLNSTGVKKVKISIYKHGTFVAERGTPVVEAEALFAPKPKF